MCIVPGLPKKKEAFIVKLRHRVSVEILNCLYRVLKLKWWWLEFNSFCCHPSYYKLPVSIDSWSCPTLNKNRQLNSHYGKHWSCSAHGQTVFCTGIIQGLGKIALVRLKRIAHSDVFAKFHIFLAAEKQDTVSNSVPEPSHPLNFTFSMGLPWQFVLKQSRLAVLSPWPSLADHDALNHGNRGITWLSNALSWKAPSLLLLRIESMDKFVTKSQTLDMRAMSALKPGLTSTQAYFMQMVRNSSAVLCNVVVNHVRKSMCEWSHLKSTKHTQVSGNQSYILVQASPKG